MRLLETLSHVLAERLGPHANLLDSRVAIRRIVPGQPRNNRIALVASIGLALLVAPLSWRQNERRLGRSCTWLLLVIFTRREIHRSPPPLRLKRPKPISFSGWATISTMMARWRNTTAISIRIGARTFRRCIQSWPQAMTGSGRTPIR